MRGGRRAGKGGKEKCKKKGNCWGHFVLERVCVCVCVCVPLCVGLNKVIKQIRFYFQFTELKVFESVNTCTR